MTEKQLIKLEALNLVTYFTRCSDLRMGYESFAYYNGTMLAAVLNSRYPTAEVALQACRARIIDKASLKEPLPEKVIIMARQDVKSGLLLFSYLFVGVIALSMIYLGWENLFG